MQETLEYLQTYGYIVLFVYSLGGGLIGIVAAGVLSALGKIDLFSSIVIASIANIIGSTFLVYLGRYQKQEISQYLQKHRRKVARVQLWLRKFGVFLILIHKYIYGFKAILPLVIGVSKYSFLRFLIWNGIASVLWGVLMGLSGRFASHFVINLFDSLKNYPYLFPVVFLIFLGIIWIFLGKKN